MYSVTVMMGRLVENPELRHTTGDIAVTTFRLAVDRPYRKDGKSIADFFDVVAWRSTAELICNYFKKGKPILVQGHFENRSYKADDGTKRYRTELIAERVSFTGDSSGKEKAPLPEPPPDPKSQDSNRPSDSSKEDIPMPTDDDLPF